MQNPELECIYAYVYIYMCATQKATGDSGGRRDTGQEGGTESCGGHKQEPSALIHAEGNAIRKPTISCTY